MAIPARCLVLPNSDESLLAIVYNAPVVAGGRNKAHDGKGQVKVPTVIIIHVEEEQVLPLGSSQAEPGDKLVWMGWHPLSAGGVHFATLTANGTFCLYNVHSGRLEMRMRVHSPEDYTLQCATATLDGETLWIGMENGDLLAVSPVLPFPCHLTDKLRENLMETINSTDYNVVEEDESRFCQQLLEAAKVKNGNIIKRPVEGMARNLAAVQGPFLIQPEPIDFDTASRILAFSVMGAHYLAVLTQGEGDRSDQTDAGYVLHILMMEAPVRPRWTSTVERLEEESSPVLTLLESNILQGIMAIDRLEFASVSSVNGDVCFLIAKHNAGLSLIDISWVMELARFAFESKSIANSESFDPTKLPVIKSTTIVDFVKDETIEDFIIHGKVVEYICQGKENTLQRQQLPLGTLKDRIGSLPLLNNARNGLKLQLMNALDHPVKLTCRHLKFQLI